MRLSCKAKKSNMSQASLCSKGLSLQGSFSCSACSSLFFLGFFLYSFLLPHDSYLHVANAFSPWQPGLWAQAKDKQDKSRGPVIEIENADAAELLQGEEREGGGIILRGRIRIKFKDAYVLADKVIVDTKNREIYAEGKLEYKDKDNALIRAERLIYNQSLAQGILYNASGYNKPVYFIGEHISLLSPQGIALSHVRFTSNTARPPHYHFSAKHLRFYPDKSFFAGGVIYYVGGTPLLALPFLYSSPQGTGIITQMGHGDTQGFFLQNTYQFGDPKAKEDSSFLPSSYKLLLDYYQNTGRSGGIEFMRYTPHLDYHIHLSYARFFRYHFRGNQFTNEVERCEGSGAERSCALGRDSYDWSKYYVLFHKKDKTPKSKHVRNVHIFYENYTHYRYDYEFGQRSLPSTSFAALYRDVQIAEGPLHPDTDWELNYEETWDSLHFQLHAKRRRVWREKENFQESSYETAQDVLPSLLLEKRFSLGKLAWMENPVYWHHSLTIKRQQDYAQNKLFHSANTSRYKNWLEIPLLLIGYFSWTFEGGIGSQKRTSQLNKEEQSQKISFEQEAKRHSYEFYFSENQWLLGQGQLFLSLRHLYKKPFNEEASDLAPVLDRNFEESSAIHETDILWEYFPFSQSSLSLHTSYDHTQYEEDVAASRRWRYPTLRSDLYLDWLNLLRPSRENLLSRSKVHFINTHIHNDYVYDPAAQESHSNLFSLSLETGGYDLYFLRRLRYLEISFQWYHVYFNRALDHMRYSFKMDLQLGRWAYLESTFESRATKPEGYGNASSFQNSGRDHVNFFEDIVASTGLAGNAKRRSSLFNIVHFHSALILDLGDWEFRLAYELEQRYIPESSGLNESQIYYEQRIFFGLNLIHFNIGAYGKRPSRFLIDRQRP